MGWMHEQVRPAYKPRYASSVAAAVTVAKKTRADAGKVAAAERDGDGA